jgi:hypothetical protein
MVYDHRETGLYTNGVRTVGSVREGRRALVTVRSGGCAPGLKPLDTAQEFKLGRIVSRNIPMGLPVNHSS